MTHPVDDPNLRGLIQLSALCDGEADAGEAERSFERWRDEPSLRARWHAYQWIGDVMRSDDLASDVEHDQAFLLALRARLADEPVVLAPARGRPADEGLAPAVAVAGGRRLRWGAPAAMAAGVMVTGALVMMNFTRSPQTAPATLLVDATPALPAPAQDDAASGVAQVGDMLRNPELDRYLNAHRQFVGGASLAVPGGVRQVAVTSDGR
ncbi:sigma-E factor negative regulatory protein [Ideonella sp.]|uniref:sigma-E factor negative regulatory protein n=1 Tax=Ideonella sp. TaxID=1929293 RepID=UPI002B488CC4|nr:sigma-E factor negative regulatory protein [Ideonella sp.]HJV69367.1 sigma-E factor negative regulatory protein [Ideonella sp.]